MINKVRTMNIPQIAHFLHFSSKKIIVECLQNRGIIRVTGREVESFLQGLMTNDIKHLAGASSMYTMFLNTKGRVLYDTIIYKQTEAENYLIECDKESILPLQKHLKMYRVRRRINVEALENEFKVWVAFNPDTTEAQNPLKKPLKDLNDSASSLKDANLETDNSKETNELQIFRDPRLSALGIRLIAKPDTKAEEILEYTGSIGMLATGKNNYRSFRYKLGIGEGVQDLPPGECFPLEANCDYLHGVSFHKGCYIGQELTARVHHTGVVRKRLMPLILNSTPDITFPVNTPIKISQDAKNSVGKLRGIEGSTGLALLRVAPALEADTLKIEGIDGKTVKPGWWPIEAPKEKITLPKPD